MNTRIFTFRLLPGVPIGRLSNRTWTEEYTGDDAEVGAAIEEDLHRYGVSAKDVSIQNEDGQCVRFWSGVMLRLKLQRESRRAIAWIWDSVDGTIVAGGYARTMIGCISDAYRTGIRD